MNNYKNFVLTLLVLLSPHTLLPSDSMSVPLMALAPHTLPPSDSMSVPLVTPTPPAETPRISRTKPCLAKTACYLLAAGGLAAGVYGIRELITPTPQQDQPWPTPPPYHAGRFCVYASAPCSSLCPDSIWEQKMCIPPFSEWDDIEKQVKTICPNSTKVELATCWTASWTPYPPCENVNTTLQKVATRCQPSTDQIAKLRAKIQSRANMRKPQRLR